MKPSYAHVPDPNAGGTCAECKHCDRQRQGTTGKKFNQFTWHCGKAVELARYLGSGLPINPETRGCKYWEYTFREANQ